MKNNFKKLALWITNDNIITAIFFVIIIWMSIASGFWKTEVYHIPVGLIGTVTGAISWVATRTIQQKKNVGNWISLITNLLSSVVAFFLGDYSRIFGSLPNLILTALCTKTWYGKKKVKIGDNKKHFYLALIIASILEIVMATAAFTIFGLLLHKINSFYELFNLQHGISWIFFLAIIRTITSYVAYLSQIFNTWHAQAGWAFYSLISLIQNIFLKNVPSIVKDVGYLFTAAASVVSWRADTADKKSSKA